METIQNLGSICSILALVLTIWIGLKVRKISFKIQVNQKSKTQQSKNKVAGDQAGRDITK